MSTRPFQPIRWSAFSFAAIAILLMTVLVACGSSDDEANPTNTSSSSSNAVTTATTSSGATTNETMTTGTPEMTGSATGSMASPGMGQLGQIGSCIQENTTSDVVSDLRDGNTDSAKSVYRDCLETQLPSTLVDQADPIIDSAAQCGVTASKNLSDEDMQQIEGGDTALIQQVTVDTMQCVSDALGIQLP